LVLFFPGCDSGSSGTTTKPPTTNPSTNSNGTLFVKKVGNNHVFISIYSYPATGNTIPPKAGATYSYAIAVSTFDANGDEKSRDVKSEGTVTVGSNGSSLTFTPGGSYSSQTACAGTYLNYTLIMDKVPGLSSSYNDLEMDISNTSITASPNYPFGTYPLEPGTDDSTDSPGSPGGTNPNTPVAKGGEFKPGEIPIRFEVRVEPDWGPKPTSPGFNVEVPANSGNFSVGSNSVTTTGDPKGNAKRRMYFEGEAVDLRGTGIVIRVIYSDGHFVDWDANTVYNEFAVEPPVFSSAYTGTRDVGKINYFDYSNEFMTNDSPDPFTLYYKAGFANSSIVNTFTTPVTWDLAPTFKGPPKGNIFPIREIHYSTPNSSVLSEWLEDDFFPFPDNDPPISVKVKWWGGPSTGNGGILNAVANHSMNTPGITIPGSASTQEGRSFDYHLKPYTGEEISISKGNYSIYNWDFPIGTTVSTNDPAKFDVSIGNWNVPFQVNAYRMVEKIDKGSYPAYNYQVVFDDPRLYGQPRNPAINLHWLNRLNDGGSIVVSYAWTLKKRTRTMVEAFNRQGLDFIKYNTEPFSNIKESIGLTYYRSTIVGYEIPVYTKLVGIELRPNTGNKNTDPYPTLHASADDGETVFLRDLIYIRAIYERTKSNAANLYRDDTYGQLNGRNNNEWTSKVNISCTDASFDSNIESILQKATNNWLKGETTKAKVTFTTGGISKNNEIEIIADGYK